MKEADEKGLIPECLDGVDLKRKITRQEFAAVSVKVYEALSGKTAELRSEGAAMLPAPLCLLAYELFETALEGSFDSLTACDALIEASSESFALKLALDAPEIPVLPDRLTEKADALGASLDAETRDDTVYITLSAALPAGKEAAV